MIRSWPSPRSSLQVDILAFVGLPNFRSLNNLPEQNCVPRRSGSQATKFWLLVESSKLGLMQESFKLVKDEQKVVEKKIGWEFKMKDAQEHKLSFCLGSVSAELDGFPARHVFLHKLAESFPLPWLDLAKSFSL